MSRPPRRSIPQRRRFFVGCEGESEQGYVGLLSLLAEDAGCGVHLDAVLLRPGGGDALALVERAVDRLRENERKRDPYEHRVVLLDADTLNRAPDRDARIDPLARTYDLLLVWQAPCHEALLLRHLEGCERFRPPNTAEAERRLIEHWPDYRKGLPARRLSDRIGRAELARAGSVERQLADFLRRIGLF